jgi:MFS family permease
VAGVVQKRLGESLGAVRSVFRNPELRRVELAWAGSVTGDWAYVVALAVFAWDAGGAAAVGLVGLIRFLPAAIAAPFAAVLADRHPRQRVMLVADVVRALALAAAAAVALLDAPVGFVYALTVLVSVVATAFQPAQAAILPSLAREPAELTAANVASSTIESVGSFAGPALGGLLVAVTDAGVVFAVTAATFLWSASLIGRVRAEPPVRREGERSRLGHEALAGFRAIAVESRLRLLVGLYAAQTLVAGALNVLIVVSAFELLDLGEAGVGFLNSAVGVGGLFGALSALALVGRRRLASGLGAGLVLWGVPIAVLGLFADPVVALVCLGAVGVGNTIVDVAGLTLLQRAVADDVLARVFGVLESLVVATIGLGTMLAPLLISGLGTRGALVATGAFLPVLAALAWRRLAALDAEAAAPGPELELLRGIPLFAPLPLPTLEHLAGALEPVRIAAGNQVVRQGEPGDRFYVVRAGEADVAIDGRSRTTLGPGGYFGEIALLRRVPRTASVSARSDLELLALGRDEFVAAVTGHAESAEAADAVIGARLGGLRAGMASV